jgi:hypothetical protein
MKYHTLVCRRLLFNINSIVYLDDHYEFDIGQVDGTIRSIQYVFICSAFLAEYEFTRFSIILNINYIVIEMLKCSYIIVLFEVVDNSVTTKLLQL